MSGQVKGITIEFRGNTTGLDRALKSIRTETNGVNSSLKSVNNALKFNPRNTELLAQKQSLLKEKIGATETQLKELQGAQKQLDASGVDKSSREYMTLRREIITTESKLKTFKGQLRQVANVKLEALRQQLASVGSKMRSVGVGMSVASAGMIAAGKKLLDLNSTQTQAEDKLTEIYRKRMGATEGAAKSTMKLASAIQEQGVVGDEVTLSGAQQLATFAKMPETVNKLLPAMDNLLVQQKGYNASAGDATNIANLMGKVFTGQTGALKRVGISFSKSQEKVLKYGNEQQKASMLAKVITKNVGDMNKKFAETPEGKLQQAKNALGDLGESFGKLILPAIAKIAARLQKNLFPKIQAFINFMDSHPIVAKIIVGVTAFMAVAGPLLIFVGSLTTAITAIIPVLTAVTAAGTPILGIVAVVAAAIVGAIALGVLIVKHWDRIKAAAKKLGATIKSAWTGIKKATAILWGGVKTDISTVWDGIKSVIKSGVNIVKRIISPFIAFIKSEFRGLKIIASIAKSIFGAVGNAITHPIQTAHKIIKGLIDRIRGLFRGLKLEFPHIKLPHFKISGGKAPWGLGGKGKMPTVGIDYYAKGGIFTKPTLLGGNSVVGERGAEAVLPLDALWEHLDGMADSIVSGIATAMLAQSGGSTTITVPVYLYPNGAKMGEHIVNAYDTYKKRLG